MDEWNVERVRWNGCPDCPYIEFGAMYHTNKEILLTESDEGRRHGMATTEVAVLHLLDELLQWSEFTHV